MVTGTVELISPNGVPVTLTYTQDASYDDIIATAERGDKMGAHFAKQGWAFAATAPALPSAAELDRGPTFCGYPCSPTVDDRGLPSWIMVDGKQAMRHEKQGDAWYSVKRGENEFEQVLKIPKGEKVPAVKGL